jgi:hypothetical protein
MPDQKPEVVNTQSAAPSAPIKTEAQTGPDVTQDAAAGIARVRRLGFDPGKIGDSEAEQLRRFGIDPETFERKAVTYNGLLKEFGRPRGPQIYNAIAVAAFSGVQSNRNALSIETLKDRWIARRTSTESDEEFARRQDVHRAQREKVYKILADAEGGNS